jgi:hypothetical protein
MDREAFSIKDLSIEELTTQAMQLLSVNLTELYAVLGFQLIGYSRPARLAAIVSYHASLQHIVDAPDLVKSSAVANPIMDLSYGLNAVYEELKQDGVHFVDTVREELCRALWTPESLDLADRATASSVQIMVLMITGALRIPPQMESLAVTLAAIICKSGLKDFCNDRPAKNESDKVQN